MLRDTNRRPLNLRYLETQTTVWKGVLSDFWFTGIALEGGLCDLTRRRSAGHGRANPDPLDPWYVVCCTPSLMVRSSNCSTRTKVTTDDNMIPSLTLTLTHDVHP